LNRRFLAACLVPLLLLVPAVRAQAQWVPTGRLAAVPVVRNCDETSGDVAVSRLDPPKIYICPFVMTLIRKKYPGAEHFFFVHEFGHIALRTSDEAAADCWAAKALAKAPNGSRDLAAVIDLLRRRPDEDSPRYGTPSGRARHIRECADDERPMDSALDAPVVPRQEQAPPRRR
jgi:hypothetical protein